MNKKKNCWKCHGEGYFINALGTITPCSYKDKEKKLQRQKRYKKRLEGKVEELKKEFISLVHSSEFGWWIGEDERIIDDQSWELLWDWFVKNSSTLCKWNKLKK